MTLLQTRPACKNGEIHRALVYFRPLFARRTPMPNSYKSLAIAFATLLVLAACATQSIFPSFRNCFSYWN